MRASRGASTNKRQLNLFEREPASSTRREQIQREAEVVAEGSLPDYPARLVELVERSLVALPENRLWFTYKDINACFGISRATVARRVKDRRVPGIRIVDGRVQQDGPVRRFDRAQLRWLLLSVRL